ncbi:hypothetical protein SAMN05660420_00934 [Desulfuromusa kysingii]|uniref:Uncharacterized protein n=1 Tax=Desulfuromusa kysingii TaxID=37625 RepID=A0A1H3XE51_9BACT|nr:multiheme c-type cytochrome [Desulfuromusa kysingii]SDZ97629.1 hypothetical protein SAMN05660420_00934 [Desulfuromusa kysingii]
MIKRVLFVASLSVLLSLLLAGGVFASSHGQSSHTSVQPKSYANPKNASQCLVCHGQLDYLRSVTADTKDGYGHDVAAETVAQGLYVGPEFVNDRIHGRQSCEFCHGGNPDATDVKLAHEGIIKDPTADGGQKICASCHQDIVKNAQTSIHFNMTGVRNKLSARLGKTHEKEVVVGQIMEGDCLACHATCGTCHIGTAPIANAGLQANHKVEVKPDNLQVCIPCHHLAGAGFFTQEKNLHVALGMDCNSCHRSEQEYHGRGGDQEQLGMMSPGLIKASCYDCHQDAATTNEAHEIHGEFVSCQACHGTEYESCVACHNRVPEDEHIFKLGEFDGKVYPMVHTTGTTSADAFNHMGIHLQQKDLESKAAWVPYTTHFLQLAPIHKEGGKVMCENCHGNDDIFLQEKDLSYPELEKQLLMDAPRKLSKDELQDAMK